MPALLGVPAGFVGIFRLLVMGQCLLIGAFFVGRILLGVLEAHQRFDILNYSQILQLTIGFATQWAAFHRGWDSIACWPPV